MMTPQQRRDRLENLLERVQKNRPKLYPNSQLSSKTTARDNEPAPLGSEVVHVEPQAPQNVSTTEPAAFNNLPTFDLAEDLEPQTQESPNAPEPKAVSEPQTPEPESFLGETSEKTRIASFDISEVREKFNAAPKSEAPEPPETPEEVIEEISEEDVEFVDEEETEESLPSIDDFPPPQHLDDSPTRVVHASSIRPPEKKEAEEPKAPVAKAPAASLFSATPIQKSVAEEAAPASSALQEAPRIFSPRPQAGGDVARVDGALQKKSYSLAAVLERAWKYGTKY